MRLETELAAKLEEIDELQRLLAEMRASEIEIRADYEARLDAAAAELAALQVRTSA